MGFFDFLDATPRYQGKRLSINRLNKRHEFLVDPYRDELRGARVLDLASHDGRWSYALSAAGAASVTGIEGRAEMIEQFATYPTSDITERISFIHGDVYEEMPRLASAGETFDVVAIYGLYYHLTDHYGLLKLIDRLRPSLVIIDSEFHLSEHATIRLATESTESHLNSLEHVAGQRMAPVGIPSARAVEVMATSLGYEVEWADWESVPRGQRGGLKEYYREAPSWKRRGTCALRPTHGREGAPGDQRRRTTTEV